MKVGGVFALIGAIFLLIQAFYAAWFLSLATGAVGGTNADVDQYLGYLWTVCFILPLIGAIFGLLGGVMALQGKKFGMALLGCILGLVAGITSGFIWVGILWPNPMGLLAFILFLIALICVGAGKKGFHS